MHSIDSNRLTVISNISDNFRSQNSASSAKPFRTALGETIILSFPYRLSSVTQWTENSSKNIDRYEEVEAGILDLGLDMMCEIGDRNDVEGVSSYRSISFSLKTFVVESPYFIYNSAADSCSKHLDKCTSPLYRGFLSR